MDAELVGLVANLGALSVAGILYAAYIKNLRSQVGLKDEQLKTAEQNIKLWKDKALDLERQTPQYVEQVLARRIRVREDEITRLESDEKSHRSEIEQKNHEVSRLKRELEATHEFGRGISIYDNESKESKQLSASELTLKDLGEVWVDSATLMICDPWHISIPHEREIEEYPAFRFWFRDNETGELGYAQSYDEPFVVDLWDDHHTARQLVEMGRLEEIPAPDELPADPETYIKGDKLPFVPRGKIRACTFLNGTAGAGLAFGTPGDGMYAVRAETYEGEILRIMIDLY